MVTPTTYLPLRAGSLVATARHSYRRRRVGSSHKGYRRPGGVAGSTRNADIGGTDDSDEWTPQQFIDAASLAPHPVDARFEPPDRLREVIRRWARAPRGDAIKTLADEIWK